MDLSENFRRLFAYENWANQETLGSLRAAQSSPPRAVKILAHIVAVEWLYFRRLDQSQQPVVV